MTAQTRKELFKSSENKILTGVIGGIGEFINVDATILRLGYIAITAFTGFFPGLIVYIIAAVVVPEKKN